MEGEVDEVHLVVLVHAAAAGPGLEALLLLVALEHHVGEDGHLHLLAWADGLALLADVDAHRLDVGLGQVDRVLAHQVVQEVAAAQRAGPREQGGEGDGAAAGGDEGEVHGEPGLVRHEVAKSTCGTREGASGSRFARSDSRLARRRP